MKINLDWQKETERRKKLALALSGVLLVGLLVRLTMVAFYAGHPNVATVLTLIAAMATAAFSVLVGTRD